MWVIKIKKKKAKIQRKHLLTSEESIAKKFAWFVGIHAARLQWINNRSKEDPEHRVRYDIQSSNNDEAQ